jgi:cupin 2 domain-containing protein
LIAVHNLFTTPLPSENGETFSTLFESETVKIEAIRSRLKTPGERYFQEENEWVILLEGEAELEIDTQRCLLHKGDYLFIPKHTPHTVLWTSENALWIGVFSS